MRQVVLFESLHFLTRDDLDACRLASSLLSNTVVRAATTLALRYIAHAKLMECHADEYATICLVDEDSGFVRQPDDQFTKRSNPLVPADDYEALFRLFNDSYVNDLWACLFCGGFLDYWLSHKDELTCRIGTIQPHHSTKPSLQSVNFDKVCVRRMERITSTLRPSAYDVGTSSVPNAFGYLALFNQEPTRNSAPHLKVYFGEFFLVCVPT